MVTLLRVAAASGATISCDARCHQARGQACSCCCGGRYHGKAEGSVSLWQAVRDHQEPILADLGRREQAGELWILGYRVHPDGEWVARPKGVSRAYQDTLFPVAGP